MKGSQLDFFKTMEYKTDKLIYRITKPIRLISLFSGYDSQLFSLKYLGANVESWRTCEWAVKSIQALKDGHFGDDNIDYSKDLSKQELIDYLFKKGISANYNEPMSYEQIKRLGEVKQRIIYNNIKATKNLVNIQQVHAEDLGIVNTDKYEYVVTYSYPCTDLSLAGNQAGMSKGSSTRSSMLWEFERILDEIASRGGQKPQLLLMENVIQVHSKKNMADFQMWIDKLTELGYSNYYQDLNAKDYGIPQNRKRTFMVSILGDYDYKFPQPIKLEKRLKDLLESDVDEKYYLSDKMIEYIKASNGKWTGNDDKSIINRDIGVTINTRVGNTRADCSDYICSDLPENTDIKLMELTKNQMQGYRVYDANGLSTSLMASAGGVGAKTGLYLDSNSIVKDKNGNTFITKGTKQLDETIQNNELEDGSMLDLYNRSVHNDIAQTIDTGYHNSQRVCVKDSMYTETEKQLFTEDGNIKRYLNSNIIDKFEEGQMATTSYPNGYGHGPRTHNESISLNTIDKPSVKQNLRIRKLTPKECFRLMGVKDKDFENIAKNQSNASLYHLAGDSIVVDVLCAIFKQMLQNS